MTLELIDVLGSFPSNVLKCDALLIGHRIGPSLQACIFQNSYHYIMINYTVNNYHVMTFVVEEVNLKRGPILSSKSSLFLGRK
jgi:hypothetical protein